MQKPLLCQVPLVLQVCVSVPQLPQETGFVCGGTHCLQAPAKQTSPELQGVLSATFVQAVVLAPGWQLWHALLGFAVPGASALPPMKQPAAQVFAALQTCPEPQAEPTARLVHAPVLVPGWQLWQALLGFTAPDA